MTPRFVTRRPDVCMCRAFAAWTASAKPASAGRPSRSACIRQQRLNRSRRPPPPLRPPPPPRPRARRTRCHASRPPPSGGDCPPGFMKPAQVHTQLARRSRGAEILCAAAVLAVDEDAHRAARGHRGAGVHPVGARQDDAVVVVVQSRFALLMTTYRVDYTLATTCRDAVGFFDWHRATPELDVRALLQRWRAMPAAERAALVHSRVEAAEARVRQQLGGARRGPQALPSGSTITSPSEGAVSRRIS